MASSDPTLVRAGIPPEAQPNNTFPVEIEVEQGGGDPWASEGGCTTPNLDVTGWETPIELVVDGEVVDSKRICLAADNRRTVTMNASLSSGNHTVSAKVYKVGGNAYDLKPMIEEVNDEITRNVSTSTDARDPSEPTSGDKLINFLDRIAQSLGTSVNVVAVGIVVGAGVILFL